MKAEESHVIFCLGIKTRPRSHYGYQSRTKKYSFEIKNKKKLFGLRNKSYFYYNLFE